MASTEGVCDTCNSPSLFNCSGCRSRQYCSESCQLKDWKAGGHKRECKALAAAKKDRKAASEAAAADACTAAEDLKERGNAALKSNDVAGAIALYDEAIALDSCNAAFWSNRAAALTMLGTNTSLERALADAEKCMSLRPSWSRGHERKGRALVRLGKLREASEAYKAGIAAVLEASQSSDVKALRAGLAECREVAVGGRAGGGAGGGAGGRLGAGENYKTHETKDRLSTAAPWPLDDIPPAYTDSSVKESTCKQALRDVYCGTSVATLEGGLAWAKAVIDCDAPMVRTLLRCEGNVADYKMPDPLSPDTNLRFGSAECADMYANVCTRGMICY